MPGDAVSGLGVLLAALPILLVLVTLIGLRWSAARAGLAGLAVALVVAWAAFGTGDHAFGRLGRPLATLGAVVEAVFVAVTILWIIFAALCIYHLQQLGGAIDVLRGALSRLSRDPRVVVLVIGWFFALFLEGAAGFGTPVALAAPLLVGLGFPPVLAVTLALVGHAAGVSFGAIGTPIVPQVEATGLDPLALAATTGAYHGIVGLALPLALMVFVTRSPEVAAPRGPAGWLWTVAAAGLFLGPMVLLARTVGPELPTLGGALVGGAAFALMYRLVGRRTAAPQPTPPDEVAGRPAGARALLRAGAPYLALVGLILLTRLVPPVADVARDVALRWTLLDTFRGDFLPLYHPGSLLFLGFLAGAALQGARLRLVRAAMAAAFRQLGPVSVALLAMLALSRVMVHAGLIDVLAAATAAALAGAWPFFAPFTGALGTFVTGSATASNILFTDFQAATATSLDLPVLPLVAAQGFGAAVGNIVAPHNIIAGCATVGATGQEGQVLRRTLVAFTVYAALGGALALVWVA